VTDRLFDSASASKLGRKGRLSTYTFDNLRVASQADFEEQQKYAPPSEKFQYRPHNFEYMKMKNVIHNANLLKELGFLDPKLMENEKFNEMLMHNQSSASAFSKKRGRPRKMELAYEDLLK